MIELILDQHQQEWLKEFFLFAWPSILVTFLLVKAWDYYKNVYSYWASIGIDGDRPVLLFVEDILNLLERDPMEGILEKANKYGKIFGTYSMGNKRIMINDPELIKLITIKEFDLFQNHKRVEWFHPYSLNNLVWIQGDQWRRTRALMTPAFTSGKIKRMFDLLQGCADDLVENLRSQFIHARRAGEDKALVDMIETYGFYTMDGITTCCYGIKLKRQQQQQKGLKRLKHKSQSASSRDSFIDSLNSMLKPRLHRVLMLMFSPKFLLRLFKFTLVIDNDLQPLVDRVQKMVDLRRNAATNQATKYDDLLQMLVDSRLDDKMELNETDLVENHHAGLTKESLEADQAKLQASLGKQKQDIKMTLNDFEILSQAMLMLAAGFDTTRSSLSSITYFLAHNPHVQDRLCRELKGIAKNMDTALGKLLVFDYDSLTTCQYLDAVISETLRIFPPAIVTDRIAQQDYRIEKCNVTIPKDSHVLLCIYSVHMDSRYWDEPHKFNPDRFMPGQREKIVPGSYLPFSLGPRHCLGMRFSLTETKLALARVLMNFKFEPAPNTLYPPRAVRTNGVAQIRNCKVLVSMRDLD